MKKILLTNPTLENERDVTDPLIPLGMPSVAAYLRQNLDEKLKFGYVNQKFPEGFKKFKPDLVFMTTMSPYYHKSVLVAKQFKDIDASVPIMVGGFHISILPHTLSPHMDVGVVGEGELTALELFPHIENPNKKIKGIVYRENGKIVVTEPRPLIHNLDVLPFPARDIMKEFINREQFTGMLTARGCPYHCIAHGSDVSLGTGETEKIENLRIGDSIKTKNGIGTVTGIRDKKKKIITLNLSNGNKLDLTPDHKVFTKRGWIEAGKLLKDDEIFIE